MPQNARDKQFRLPKVTIVDFKTIEMDRTLTALFARIHHRGEESRLSKPNTTVETFLEHFAASGSCFQGFEKHPEILRGWLESHLLDLVNRGKHNQQVAAPRPLHGYTYRFRNPRICRDYGSAEHVYEMLAHARNGIGQMAIDGLRSFFFEGVDPNTHKVDARILIDVETQALLSLSPDDMKEDAPLRGSRTATPPLCIGAADLMADDLMRLLLYRGRIPRSVMVEYLKILMAFHLALYHLRLMKLLPELVRRKGEAPCCESARCSVKPGATEAACGDCPFQPGLFLDVRNQPGVLLSALAEKSAEFHFRRIPAFVKALFLVKKLDEFATDQLRLGRLAGGVGRSMSVSELLQLLAEKHSKEKEVYFQARLLNMTDGGGSDESVVVPEWEPILQLGLDNLDAFVECLTAQRGAYVRSFVVKCLDAFMLKNRPGALSVQSRSKNAPRRFTLDSRLLEVLLQINVLAYEPSLGRYHSKPIQLEALLRTLRERYGLYIDKLPIEEGFSDPSIEERQVLRDNTMAFKEKLREIGFFQDLSDASISQHVRPRYQID